MTPAQIQEMKRQEELKRANQQGGQPAAGAPVTPGKPATGVTPAAPGTAPAAPLQPTPGAKPPIGTQPALGAPPAAPGATTVAPGQPTPGAKPPVSTQPATGAPPAAPGATTVTPGQPAPGAKPPPVSNQPTPGAPPLVPVILTPPAAPPQPKAKRQITPLEAATLGLGAGLIGGYLLGRNTGGQPYAYEDVRRSRQETVIDGTTIYREPGRTIIREDNRIFITHDENDRFRDLGGDLRSERRDGRITTIYDRPDGTRIVTITDDSGRLLRRSRRFRDGREFVLIDNSYEGPRRTYDDEIVYLPPPPVPVEHYIVEAEDTDERIVYQTLTAPPVARLPRRYTLDEVRQSPDLRNHMRSVDVNSITFESGSFAVSTDQVQRLTVIATPLLAAVKANPSEVFLVEGYTDAVGSDVDNLSLSDRRAQAVASILTKDFGVPPENLTTQGYGAQYPKVKTEGDSQANRRVTVRRITPLINPQAAAQAPEAAPAQ